MCPYTFLCTHSHIHCSTICNSQDAETTQVSINRWTDKKGRGIYTQWGITSHQRSWKSRKEILPFSTNGWALSTFCWDKSDKVKQVYCMMSFASQVVQVVKNLPAMQETQVQSLGWGDPPDKEMATPSSILTWRIPWKEEPVGLKSMGLQS